MPSARPITGAGAGRPPPAGNAEPAPARHKGARERVAPGLLRLHKRLAEVVAIDFFGASGRERVEGVLTGIEAALRPTSEAADGPATSAAPVRGRTWVTRSGVHVDRIASAWLIRRFIDPEARFKFIRGQAYSPEPGELRFDMFEAEFTHEGEQCTFEVLRRRFGLEDRALSRSRRSSTTST